MPIRIMLSIVFFLVSCTKSKSTSEPTAAAATSKAPMVMTEVLTAKTLFDIILYPARVDAGSQAAVLSDTDGLISTIKTSLGRFVKKGDVLFTVENPDPVYRYAPISVIAPVSGVISFLDANVGNRIEKGRKLAIIADISDVKITLEATTSDLGQFKVGQLGDFTVDNKKVTLKISAISPVVDPATGTATVELAAKKADRLIPGMLGRVEFRVRERTGIQVSDSAFVYKGTDPYLRTVESNIAHWRKINAGSSTGGFTEILSGVKAGDVIISRATAYIGDGDKVEIQAAKKDEVARP
jgi:multidrug efflux pump subunit AcrA (membrane-fusion protein)